MRGLPKRFLNQEVTWLKHTGQDAYGQPQFDEVPIKVRWEGSRRLVRNEKGEQVVSETKVFALEPITKSKDRQDQLKKDGETFPVIAVSELPDRRGNIHHREVRL